MISPAHATIKHSRRPVCITGAYSHIQGIARLMRFGCWRTRSSLNVGSAVATSFSGSCTGRQSRPAITSEQTQDFCGAIAGRSEPIRPK